MYRRNLESPERKAFRIRERHHSESRFAMEGHLMQRPSPKRVNRSLSTSPYKYRNKEWEENGKLKKVKRKLNLELIDKIADVGVKKATSKSKNRNKNG